MRLMNGLTLPSFTAHVPQYCFALGGQLQHAYRGEAVLLIPPTFGDSFKSAFGHIDGLCAKHPFFGRHANHWLPASLLTWTARPASW